VPAGTHEASRILLVQDLHVTVIDAATGEILRDLIIDPPQGLPTHRPPTRPHKEVGRTCRLQVRPIPMSGDITPVGTTGFEPATP
jgi:hypothetical protein